MTCSPSEDSNQQLQSLSEETEGPWLSRKRPVMFDLSSLRAHVISNKSSRCGSHRQGYYHGPPE